MHTTGSIHDSHGLNSGPQARHAEIAQVPADKLQSWNF